MTLLLGSVGMSLHVTQSKLVLLLYICYIQMIFFKLLDFLIVYRVLFYASLYKCLPMLLNSLIFFSNQSHVSEFCFYILRCYLCHMCHLLSFITFFSDHWILKKYSFTLHNLCLHKIKVCLNGVLALRLIWTLKITIMWVSQFCKETSCRKWFWLIKLSCNLNHSWVKLF